MPPKPSCLCGKCKKCCSRRYARTYRKRHPDKYAAAKERQRAKAVNTWPAALERRGRWLDEYKLERGCLSCGYREHPAALIFHHRDPSTKRAGVMMLATHAWETLLAEIEKCDVLCSNCHAIHHWAAKRHQSSPIT